MNRSILSCIGNTSLLPLRKIVPQNGAQILLKIESENPTGSMKDRMALAMIEAAEKDGRLKSGGAGKKHARTIVADRQSGELFPLLRGAIVTRGPLLNAVARVVGDDGIIGRHVNVRAIRLAGDVKARPIRAERNRLRGIESIERWTISCDP